MTDFSKTNKQLQTDATAFAASTAANLALKLDAAKITVVDTSVYYTAADGSTWMWDASKA